MNDYLEVLGLIEKLCDKPKELICLALVELMSKGKIDFITVSNAYTTSLKKLKEDSFNQLIEAEDCVRECLDSKGGKKNFDPQHIQRCLYLLNKANRYNMERLNEKYNYDEEEGKRLSVYERNKK